MKYSLVFLAMFLFPLAALGQTPHPDCPESSANYREKKTLARDWFNRGHELVSKGNLTDALAAYACSYRFIEHENTLFNMALTAVKSGDDPLAIELFQKYVDNHPKGPFEEKSHQRIDEIKNRAERASENQQQHQDIDTGPQALEKTPQISKPKRVVGLSSVIIGATFLVTGTIFQIAAYKQVDRSEATSTIDDSHQYTSKAKNYLITSTSLYVTAGFLTAAGTMLLLSARKDDSRSVALRVHPGGINVVGTF